MDVKPAALREAEPFNQLPEEAVAKLESAALVKTYSPGIFIFRQHDPPTGYLYVIQHGLVEIVALAPGGVEMVVDYRQDHSFFGGTPFFTNDPYTAGARTVKQTVCSLIPHEVLSEVAESHPQLKDYFTRSIISRVRSLYADMVDDYAGNALNQIEAFPFQKRLSEIMTPDVAVCRPGTRVSTVASRMIQSGIGAVLVGDREDPVRGIITEHDLVENILTGRNPDGLDATAAEVMTPNPLSMTPDTYMYEASAFMARHNIGHLPILAADEVVGMVTLQDLMKHRSQKSILLVGGAKEARTLDELADIKAEIVKVAKAQLSDARSPFEAMEIVSYLHQCILRRGFELVMQGLQQRGETPPDVRYCFFLMGSGGRNEMLLDPDQDHGIIFEDYPDELHDEVEGFFVPFLEQLVSAYATLGYPRCKGGVMATSPHWRGRLNDWRQRLTDWIKVPEPQKVRYSNNFFDFSPLVGDEHLCVDLHGIVHELINDFPLFLYHLMELNFKHKVPLGLMGGFAPERSGEQKGKVPTKQTGSLFIVDCLRIFHLEQQLDATSTTERLELLVKRKVFARETAEHIQAAFQAFTYLRLRQEIALIEQGLPPTHYIDPHSLSKNEQDLLKEAYRAASKLQDATRRHFSRLLN